MKSRFALLTAMPLLLVCANIQASAQDTKNDPVLEEAALTPDIIAVNRDRQRRMTVPVSINGSGPFHFIIDTGAERTVVSTDVASFLGLELLKPARVVGVAGVQTVDIAYIPELTMGRQTYSNLETPLLIDANMGADGILGLDGLQSQQVLFNFNDSTISILGANTKQKILEGEEITVTAKRKSGQLIFTDATINGVRVDVVIDTGAHTSIGNEALKKRLYARNKDRLIYSTKITSVTGQSIDADVIITGKLKIDRLVIPELPVAFADTPAFHTLKLTEKPALLLGMDVLRQFGGVSINFASRKISFILRDDAYIQRDFFNDDATRIPRA